MVQIREEKEEGVAVRNKEDINKTLTRIKWVGWFLFNSSITDIFKVTYGDASNDYFKEKEKMFNRNCFEWFLNLDHTRQENILTAALNKYEEKG